MRVAAAALLLTASLAAEEGRGTVLVRYGFDDESLATGPDTVAVFRTAHGRVGLTSAFHVSGYRAVEISDVAGNGDFSELQGYFPAQRAGRIYARFALLTARPDQELNVALAGPAGFRLGKDGIAFWLATRQGRFVHVSDSMPRKLAAVHGFTWYTVEVAYDVETGRYDLAIHEEGRPEAVVDLRAQPGAASQPASAVDKFSFISDPMEDASAVTYYVDDVVIGTSREVVLGPLVAPGRRKLFVDAIEEYRRGQAERPRCPPVTSAADLGIRGPAGAAAADAAAQRAAQWQEACRLLEVGRFVEARARFEASAAALPEARLYGLGAALALTAAGRLDEAEQRLASLRAAWGDDARYALALAALGMARGDMAAAEEALRDRARDTSDARVAERYFQVLFWGGRWREAREYALGRGAPEGTLEAAAWWEHAGDAAFQLRDLDGAQELYERAASSSADERSVLLKLADVAYLMHDFDAERRYRERYYGSLED